MSDALGTSEVQTRLASHAAQFAGMYVCLYVRMYVSRESALLRFKHAWHPSCSTICRREKRTEERVTSPVQTFRCTGRHIDVYELPDTMAQSNPACEDSQLLYYCTTAAIQLKLSNRPPWTFVLNRSSTTQVEILMCAVIRDMTHVCRNKRDS